MHPIDSSSVFDLKGSVLTVMVLQLRQVDPALLYPQLAEKIGPARSFFLHAPVLIDLKELDEDDQLGLNFSRLATTLRALGMVPVGVRGQAAAVDASVLAAGLALLPSTRGEKAVPAPEMAAAPAAIPEEPSVAPVQSDGSLPSAGTRTLVVSQPVRSGQQVVAPEGDLIVLASVNAGAEVMAAGNIHIYGALRGRALAGIHGNQQARIFSLLCNPELAAVAGEYVVNERLKKSVINQCVLISLREGHLRFEVIGSFNPR